MLIKLYKLIHSRIAKFCRLSFAHGVHDYEIPFLDWQWIFHVLGVRLNDIAIDRILYSRVEGVLTYNCNM
jgi:hypothetical protein